MEKSLWQDSILPRTYPQVTENLETEVLVVGGGMVGILTAFLLQSSGLDTVLIDANTICGSTGGRNTGKLTAQHDDCYHRLMNGGISGNADDYYRLNIQGMALVERLVKQFDIGCGLQRKTAYIYTQKDENVQGILEEYAAYQQLGIAGELLDKLPVPIPVKKALSMENQLSFNAFAFVQRIAEEFCLAGGRIYENSTAVAVKEGTGCVVECGDGSNITCARLVIASHFPFFDGGGMYFTRLAPQRSYLLAIPVKKSMEGMYISVDSKPLCDLRSVNFAEVDGKGYLLVGGEGHRTGDMNPSAYTRLSAFAEKNFSAVGAKYRWSAQDYSTTDMIPYVGRLTKDDVRIFVATGFCKWGNSFAAGSAQVLHDIITNGESEFQDFLCPTRLESAMNVEFIKDNMNSMGNFISGKMQGGHNNLPTEPWDGRIVELEGNKYGCCKDDCGNMHMVDISCPHMGCELKYNPIEHSWDCPCHASRFSYDGAVLEGPAVRGLHMYGEGKNKVDPKLFD